MSKGTIILVPFPFTDLSGQKVRPCLVLHNSPKGEDFIVAFLSSSVKGKSEFDIPVSPTPKNGLKIESVLKINKIATLQKKIAIGELGILETQTLKLVDKKLVSLFKIKS